MQETFTLISNFIGQIGFPIAVAVYMIYTNNKQTEIHAAEEKAMITAVNELKVVIQALTDKLDEE